MPRASCGTRITRAGSWAGSIPPPARCASSPARAATAASPTASPSAPTGASGTTSRAATISWPSTRRPSARRRSRSPRPARSCATWRWTRRGTGCGWPCRASSGSGGSISSSHPLDSFFAPAPAGLAILDRELRFRQLNETLALMNGRSVAEHLGKPVREVLPAIAPTLEPLLGRILKVNPALVAMLGYDSEAEVLALELDRDVYVDAAERARNIERARTLERISGVQVQWKRRDGHHITVRLSGRVVRSEGDGAIKGFEMMAEDVTEQR